MGHFHSKWKEEGGVGEVGGVGGVGRVALPAAVATLGIPLRVITSLWSSPTLAGRQDL